MGGGKRASVTVAVDGRPESWTALRWAIAEGWDRGGLLRLVHVAEAPVVDGWYQPHDYDAAAIAEAADRILAEAVVEARARSKGLPLDAVLADGDRADQLLAESERTDLLVLGARGGGRLAGAALGSVSSVVAARARCPVVIVRGIAGYPEGHVVVGVDGSPVTDAVLAFAFDHASRHQLPLRAVLCWRPYAVSSLRRARSERQARQHRLRAAEAMAEAMAAWQDKYPEVPVERYVLERHPVDGLIEESLRANLLVVGAHGRRGSGPVLGSVSQGVLHHATSPVAVVHAATCPGLATATAPEGSTTF
ncbi:universal stress protein [Thermasporomyces composti]|jgi:nucleotide-binding universal stress UspA family protein|uniref:Nucleotide-binding universal stress UspA family protein n=1 Tax=Thermasporomyces composti TaxID=696763 RepID=A0A3D9V9A2_THECX|nr:universal stress protein [Thermasporomyces composti]REF38097.1 nucleotide-binding universal stress UspA family protein [Thermasporomyces composti]